MSMRFDIISIFPKIFDSYFSESIIQRARKKKLVHVFIHDLRAFSRNTHKKVDDRPYGGGPGMVLTVDALMRAISSVLGKNRRRAGKIKKAAKIVFFSAGGTQFNQKMASAWAKKYRQIILVAGHYEGIDERVKKIFSKKTVRARYAGVRIETGDISIGPYVLTGGELPAMVALDAVIRHIPGVLGKETSLEENRYGVGVPAYTRPEVFTWQGEKYSVPHILLSGNHKKIDEWRARYGKGGN